MVSILPSPSTWPLDLPQRTFHDLDLQDEGILRIHLALGHGARIEMKGYKCRLLMTNGNYLTRMKESAIRSKMENSETPGTAPKEKKGLALSRVLCCSTHGRGFLILTAPLRLNLHTVASY